MQKYGKFGGTRFYKLRHESKMWLLQTHSPTSKRRGYEAEKERQEKGKERRHIRKGREKTSTQPPPYRHQGEAGAGAGRECIDGNPENRATAEFPVRGEGGTLRRKVEHKTSHSPVPQSEYSQNTQIAPGSTRGGDP